MALDEAFRLALVEHPDLQGVPIETATNDIPESPPERHGRLSISDIGFVQSDVMGRKRLFWGANVNLVLQAGHDDRQGRAAMSVAARQLEAVEVRRHLPEGEQELVELDLVPQPAAELLNRGLPEDASLVVFAVTCTRDPETA